MRRSDQGFLPGRYQSFDIALSPDAAPIIDWFPPVRSTAAVSMTPVISSRSRRAPTGNSSNSSISVSSAGRFSNQEGQYQQQQQQTPGMISFQSVLCSTSSFPGFFGWRSQRTESCSSSSIGASVHVGTHGEMGATIRAEGVADFSGIGLLSVSGQAGLTPDHLQPTSVMLEAISSSGRLRSTLQLDATHAAQNLFIRWLKCSPVVNDLTVGCGLLLKRNLGANLLTGFSARIGERVWVQAQGDALRRLCCCVSERGMLIPNLAAALRLRMNIISFERTEFDLALSYRLALIGLAPTTGSDSGSGLPTDCTLHASWSSAGVAIGASITPHAPPRGGGLAHAQRPGAWWSLMHQHVARHFSCITLGMVVDKSRATQFFAAIVAE